MRKFFLSSGHAALAPWLSMTIVSVSLLAAACSSSPVAGGNTTPGTAEPETPTAPASTTAPDHTTGTPVKTTAGKVTVTPSNSTFAPARAITATIGNGTTKTIYVENLHTGCSIAILQHQQSSGDWADLPDCGSERRAAVLAIGPGNGRDLQIEPTALQQPLPTGTYRLVIGWRTSPTPEGLAEHRSTSPTFTIK